MPGYEFWGEEEKKHVNDVLETGILMRYGFDGCCVKAFGKVKN
jgi:8-amino-3,8-dideoxy-alpha-D-manno-octulosonate transaminase